MNQTLRKKTLPKGKFVLNTKNPMIQNIVIEIFKTHGIKVEKDTDKFDPRFPYLQWYEDSLTQRMDNIGTDVYNLEEFLSKFLTEFPTELQLNSEYKAQIDFKDRKVKVGCQTFTFAKIIELAKLLK